MSKILELSKLFALIIVIMSVSSVLVSAAVPTPVPPTPQNISEGEKAHFKGVIIKRNGDIVTMRTRDNDVKDIVLENETRVESPTWWWAKKRSITNLSPGLRVEVWGKGNSQGQLVARKITFDSHDLKVLEAISGGVAPLEAETAVLRDEHKKLEARQTQLEGQQQRLAGQQDELQSAQQQLKTQQTQMQGEQDQMKGDLQRTKQETAMLGKRISELDDYETRYTTKVKFATGRATLTSEAKAALDDIADKALGTEGYLVEVAGFTDSVGKEANNVQLSRLRALAVIQYLEDVKRVPIRRVLTPAGFGESQPVADNNTSSGRAENRRAEVKVLASRAFAKQ
jgi:outer membrane protein OmpA-like peptidoglycan-associated protein